MSVESAIRSRLAKSPRCVHCRKPCVANQKNPAGQPAHLSCQSESTLIAKERTA